MGQGNSDESFDFENLYDCLMLDSGTTHSIIANEKLLVGITTAKVPIRMSTNEGEKTIAKEAQLLGAGTVYHDVSCIANPLSLGELSDRYRITMDTAVDNAFYIHMDNGRMVKFSRGKNNLYLNKPTQCFLNKVAKTKERDKTAGVSNVLTLKETMEGFSRREI